MSTKKLQIIGGTILQPDWLEDDSTSVKYIDNKPDIPTKLSDLDDDIGFSTEKYVDDHIFGGETVSVTTATKATFAPNSPENVDSALSLLGHLSGGIGNEYIWERFQSTNAYFTTADLSSVILKTTVDYNTVIIGVYTSEISVSDDGVVELLGAPTTFSATTNDISTLNGTLRGKYIRFSGETDIYYVDNSAEFSYVDGAYQDKYNIVCSSAGLVSGHGVDNEHIGYVSSIDSNAYPPIVSDGYTYASLGKLGHGNMRIDKISYVGTGTYGVSDGEINWTSVIFPSKPDYVIFGNAIYARGANIGSCITIWDNNVVKWYSSTSAADQCNISSATYIISGLS